MTEPLIDQYHSFMTETWIGDEDSIPLGMILTPDGSIIMVALALEPEQAYEVFLAMVVKEEAVEAVFALDRFTKPGQGTKYGDVLAGHYFNRALGRSPWHPFIIEYDKATKHFEPVNWDNMFWNDSLLGEIAATMRVMVSRLLDQVRQS